MRKKPPTQLEAESPNIGIHMRRLQMKFQKITRVRKAGMDHCCPKRDRIGVAGHFVLDATEFGVHATDAFDW
jgi:hypothetical protein